MNAGRQSSPGSHARRPAPKTVAPSERRHGSHPFNAQALRHFMFHHLTKHPDHLSRVLCFERDTQHIDTECLELCETVTPDCSCVPLIVKSGFEL